MKKIRLVTHEEAWKRARRIKTEYEFIHGIRFDLERAVVPLAGLVPTQAELSETKLLVVLQEIKHGYDAPIIVIPYGGRYYIIDGHHRAFALRKLGFREVEAIVVKPTKEFLPGVVRTAEKRGLKSLEDVKIVRD
ncbi:ParB/RepB/Spo0J family partition protein [Thermococcus celer]|uniref:Inosine-5-monophosphate dehydrogenase n=1 Tax=Thermococcus celer Vu 13 = JCM 8558 TaxID=1293037 RepID=A0A218P3T3_THECE|nr:ParB/RepB/Spo0J family partition protein [Thermococcus celer]ASI99585.1 inosine-5-monophosphate dehydrogenase [Thermococcus celer Vu 13 = JCM 8558]